MNAYYHTSFHSQKEKLALFAQISDCIQSPSLRNNAHYMNYLSNAISILLMFCEELDSVTRMRYVTNFKKNKNYNFFDEIYTQK